MGYNQIFLYNFLNTNFLKSKYYEKELPLLLTALLLLAMTISGQQKVEGFIDNSTIATATYTIQLGMVPIFVISKRTD